MKRMLRKIITAALCGCALIGMSAAIADNVPMNRRIVEIKTYNDYAAIRFTPPYANDLGCSSNSWALIDWTNDSNNKSLYVVALTAHMTGQTVGMGIFGCNTRWGNVPNVYRLDTLSNFQ